MGDAALTADPLFGVGCGWAFQTAQSLLDETRSALLGHGDLDAALDRYRRVVRRRLCAGPPADDRFFDRTTPAVST